MQGRARMRKSGGEIVEVEGGHIVRSTGRKDRHSKVCTAKGPRDRRVRLAAHTAIQFYDVQDRLGYDRPSKAVDWLINKAKAAIDDLAHLPPWHPTSAANTDKNGGGGEEEEEEERRRVHRQFGADLGEEEDRHRGGGGGNNSSFLPPSLDSDAIADTIKSFFPAGGAAAEQFHTFTPPDLLPRSGGGAASQDLRLSLQSFQDLHHHHHNHSNEQTQPHQNQIHQTQVLLSGGGGGGLDGWPEHHHFQRLAAWNASGGDAAAAYLFNLPPQQQHQHQHQHQQQQQPMLQQLLGQNQFVSQRGPLQSSNTPSIRAWIDPSALAIADHHHHHHTSAPSISSIGFASGGGGFSGFHIPARIQGDKEEHDGYSDKPSSASSDSRH